jgi:hypothetical protein
VDWQNELLMLTIEHSDLAAARSGLSTVTFQCVAWSPDCKTLVAGATDGKVHVFRSEAARRKR